MEGRVVFASDFHLTGADPAGIETFCRFVAERVAGASDFYILGDLFDLWIGRAQLRDPLLAPAYDALLRLSCTGTGIHLFHGNRDFLLGRKEAFVMGGVLAGDSQEVILRGQRVLLTHGDVFCTHDLAYQRMKRIIRSAPVRIAAALVPGVLALKLAGRLRNHSERVVAAKPALMTSIQIPAVIDQLRSHCADTVVCGHVHRSFEEDLPGGGRLVVLSEWRDGSGTYAETRDGLIRRATFPA